MASTLGALAAAAVLAAGGATSSAVAAPARVPGSASPAEFEGSRATSRSTRIARAGTAANPWQWSASARSWSRASGVLPAALVARGPRATITRGQFLAALLRVEAVRSSAASGSSEPRLFARQQRAPALVDAREGSAAARAVAYGWMTARGGHFNARAPITANEAALATAGMLGLRRDVVALTRLLRREVPGARVSLYSSAHALTRTVGLRYNVKDPHDALELGPTDAVNVAHGAYMLHVAATGVEGWKLDEARALAATLDLPALGANQQKVLVTALRQLGQPYIWAGETEGPQAEGKGGFDCSGFAIRVINQAGVEPSQISPIGERTSYTQSAIPAARRIQRSALQPGDAMFFGERGPASTPGENFHVGVYMGNGWFIHSTGSNAGVAINRLDGWWGEHFSWGRRALRVA